MLAFVVLLFAISRLKDANAQLKLPDEPNVLTPPYFNIATGKKIDATATCGEEERQVFCKLTGGPNEYGYGENLYQGQFCDECDSRDPTKSHSINYAIDGTEKWWQSPPLSQGIDYNRINITIHLGQVFHVAYTIIKFANSPRAGTWVLERSSDHGKTFQPWQYFANSKSDCHNLFGIDEFEDITRDDSVICTSEYSDVVPLERGEVIVSMINRRPGANNFSHSPILQGWTKATDVRLRLLRTKTLLGHLMAVQRQDPTVTRRYFYSIKDISIGGRCVCNGHADTCVPDPEDKYKSKCDCRHHTCGDSCEYCCPGFVQKAWRAAVPESANECEACNCYGHATQCVYDEQVAIRRLSIDIHGNYEGGGVCQNCSHNTTGINCEQCADGYYRPANVDVRDPNGCRPCDCDSAFTVGTCEPVTGRCYCKPQYAGDRCDRCAPGYHEFPECEPCPCFFNATRDGICEPNDAGCPCKYNYAGMYCSECAIGFYNFPECMACTCIGQGAVTEFCDQYTGQCECQQGFGGLNCDKCSPGFYNYPTCQSCSCLAAFTTEGICDETTGECHCANLIAGELCNQCIDGYFDFPNCRECECSPEGSVSDFCDAVTGKCECKPNYQGRDCDECAAEFYGYPNCLPCDCDVLGSVRTTCDAETGRCSCRSFITGSKCQQCAPDYFNFPRCEDCKCNPTGIKAVIPGECLAFTAGQCDCKDHVVGMYCDKCDSLHYNLTLGCIDCGCFVQGTLDGVASCAAETGECTCKIYSSARRCTTCLGGFYGLQNSNYFGCNGCQCNPGGAYDSDCNVVDGQCRCKDGVTGRRCDSVEDGRYFPTLLQYQFEVEDGETTDGGILRVGFDNNTFPGYSSKGYGEFSIAQRQIIVPVTIPRHGLYRIYFHYIQPYGSSVANVTFSPVSNEGSIQSFEFTFEVTITPKLFAASDIVLVLNQGEWNVIIKGEPGLMIDYFALLPSQYYEPTVLQAKLTEPCKPMPSGEPKECIMYTHPPINHGSHVNTTEAVDERRLSASSSPHPNMVILDGNSIDGYDVLKVSLTTEIIGRYVLVLEYASTLDLMQIVEATVTSGITSPKTKFNIYSCDYSFLCRQVALSFSDEVAVFDIREPDVRVELKVDPGELVHVNRIYAIPYREWTMEYVEPKRRCITKEGVDIDDCISWTYPLPETGRKFEASGEGETSGSPVPTATDATVRAEYIDENTTLQINMDLTPGKYLFILHYYNPYHLSFSPSIVLAAGVVYEGEANVTHCPSGDGCRAVFATDHGEVFLDVTVSTQTMTITVPSRKSFWLDFVLAIPEDSYKASFLDLMRYDYSRVFFEKCYGVGGEGLIDMVKSTSEFCRDAVFTLSMELNDEAMKCQCDELGTVGGTNASCEAYGGQCPCRQNVIGRHCEQCAFGFHGFPNCEPCDCNGKLCDELNGNCICPPNAAEPDCTSCAPFTHSYHPLAGCAECNCNTEGVENAADLGCSKETGQCRCKANVEGPKCDKCSQGFFSFPECRPCVCLETGTNSEECDPISGQCSCKENVEGQQCDRCKSGTFYLDGSNPLGCTACFCFGVSSECSGTLFPVTEITEMGRWGLLNLKTPAPEVRMEGRTTSVDIIENGGIANPSGANPYWVAPAEYLGDKLGSYGGELRYITDSQNAETGGRGDNADELLQPAPLRSSSPDVILQGNGFVIGWKKRDSESGGIVNLTESNFVHQTSGDVVKRKDMMTVLSNLTVLHIKASDDPQAVFVSLSDVSLTTTDYHGSIGSGATIPTVEECICPKGYSGESCQICSPGHHRENQGPYLGYCAECDCNGHCDQCDTLGNIIAKEDCQHNTAGEQCEVCKDGYIGDPTSRDPDACELCPCPHASAEGNFAKTCYYDEDNVVCNCEQGYVGDRCEQCDTGYFGNPAVIGGKCQLCNCHGNLDLSSDLEPCNTITGECSDCKFNTGGKYCERCREGYYGDAVDGRNCTECLCDKCGMLRCDSESGTCACQAHVIGDNCDRCEPGFYDLKSCTGCHDCKCSIGAKNKECNEVTGQCDCAPNVVGLKCDKCDQGHWNYSSTGCELCSCHNGGDCNPVNGECKCPPGITGRQCDKCEMPRYVLPPGGSHCEPCDDCTHVLLDDIELLTGRIRGTNGGVEKISVGVYALRKLHGLESRSKRIEMTIKEMDGQMDAVNYDGEKLLKSSKSMLSEDFVSGSGVDESSGQGVSVVLYKEEKVDSYDGLLVNLGKVEEAVSEMCNHTESLMETVEKTSTRATMLNSKYNPAAAEAREVEENFRRFIEELNAESSGVDSEYAQNLADIIRLLEITKLRNFTSLSDMANFELTEAEKSYSRVSLQYASPVRYLEEQVGNLENDLVIKGDKLRKMRNLLTAVVGTATETVALNSVNQRELKLFRTTVTKIQMILHNINEIIMDSHRILTSNSSRVLLSDENLFEDVEGLMSALNSSGNETLKILSKAEEHSIMLKNHSILLRSLIGILRNDTNISSAVVAANRYRNILNALGIAKTASDKAHLDAVDALDEARRRDISALATNKSSFVSDLLYEVQALNSKLEESREKLDMVRAHATHLNQLSIDLSQRLNHTSVSARLDSLKIDREDEIGRVRNMTNDAGRIAGQVMRRTGKLQRKIAEAPDPDISINNELISAQDDLEEIPNILEEAVSRLAELRIRGSQLVNFTKAAALDDKMKRIRKLIELSRSSADNVKVALKFRGGLDTSSPTPAYVQPRLPVQIANTQDFLKVELYLNATVVPDSSILYLGDVSSDSGDYLSLETRDGKVHFNYKVGDGQAELVSNIVVNDDRWHHIIAQRIGNKGRLEVQLPNPDGEDIFNERAYRYDTRTGETNSESVKSNMPVESMVLVIGSVPFSELPSAMQNREMSGSVRGVALNGERVGLWNFVSYNGAQPGLSADGGEKASRQGLWKFRGYDSYLRASSDQLTREGFIISYSVRNTIIQFKLQTKQTNALLFLFGKTEDQFFAVEIIDGKFVVTCNFGWSRPRQAIAKDFPEVNRHTSPLWIKTGVVLLGRARRRMVVLAINSVLKLNITFTSWAPNLRGDGWVGGVHRYEIPEGLRKHVKTIDKNFRGCLGNLAFHYRKVFNMFSAYENMGVTPGCSPEMITTVGVDGNDYIIVPTMLRDAEVVDGLVNIRTQAENGTVVLVNEQANDNYVSLSVVDGYIVLSDGTNELRSVEKFNDGLEHTIKFDRNSRGSLKFIIDDSYAQEMEAEETPSRRKRRAPLRESAEKMSLFAKSPVHVYVGGHPSGVNFSGCIGNIHLDDDTNHQGLLTQDARCGFAGNIKCHGKPDFNGCILGPADELISAKLESKMVTAVARTGNGEVSAIDFTNGETLNGDDDINGHRRSEDPRGQRKRGGRGKGKKNSGKRAKDTVLGIDPAQLYDDRYDRGCHLPLEPDTRGWNYTGQGYSEYSVDNFISDNWRFSLNLRTLEREGVIFFMAQSGHPGFQEHIAVYLAGGKITLSVRFGSRRIRIKSKGKCNDGNWHNVTFELKAARLQMIIDNTMRHQVFEESSNTFSTLMLFYVGGLQAREMDYASSFISRPNITNFRGCIQNLAVNNQLVAVSSLARLLVKINVSLCFESETEEGIFFSNSDQNENGAYMMVYNTYNVETNLDVSMQIRPRAQSGVLLAVGGQTGNFFQLTLVDGKVVARVRQETDTLMSVYDPTYYDDMMCDGTWHKIHVIKAKNILNLTVDGNMVTPIEQGKRNIRSCDTDGPLFIGGVPVDANVGKLLSDRRQFTGCMKDIRVDHFKIKIDTPIEVTPGVSGNACPQY